MVVVRRVGDHQSVRSLGQAFDGHPNALNAMRLALALEVLLWHSLALRGGTLPGPLRALVSDIGVDGFFAVSGLLITRAWLRRPSPGRFLVARARRILPGLWVSLAVTVAVIVPAAGLAAGRSIPSWSDRIGWAWTNAHLGTSWSIGDSLDRLPNAAWNGSLWTLKWEVFCYLLVLVLGALRLLRLRVVVGLLIAVWTLAATVELSGAVVAPHAQAEYLWMPQRGFLMFLCGAALWLARDHVRVDGRLAMASAAAVALGPVAFDDYRLIAAPGITYLAVYVALRLGAHPRFVLRDDVSYGVYIYAFPLQQALLLAGFDLGWAGFSVLSILFVIPVAAASWLLVEQPLLRRPTPVWRRPPPQLQIAARDSA